MFFFFKHKTAYEMRISDWSSDVCSSDLGQSSYRAWSGSKPTTNANHARYPQPGKTKRRGQTAPPVFRSNRLNLLQQVLDHARSLGEIHLARIFLLQRIHALAHVAQALGAGFADHRLAKLADLVFQHLLRHEALDHRDFLALLRCKLGPAGIGIDFRGFLALFDNFLKNLHDLVVGDRTLRSEEPTS